MESNKLSWKPESLKKYFFPLEPIPRFQLNDPKIDEYISKQQPVIIENSNLIKPAFKWNLDYLKNNFGTSQVTVFESENKKFKYFDEKKIKNVKNFIPPFKTLQMTIDRFNELVSKNSDKSYYLQQLLSNKVSAKIMVDFIDFDWKLVDKIQNKHFWGPLTSNLLLVSQPGNITPCHYDEQENLYCQATGLKRVIIMKPENFSLLYIHPYHHPHDRQSQVDFEIPNFEEFPKFKSISGFDSVLQSGDVLYIPSYWFHHFETLDISPPSTALTFWYKSAPVTNVTYPLKNVEKMAIMRNIEKMICEALNNHEEEEKFWKDFILGRYCKGLEKEEEKEEEDGKEDEEGKKKKEKRKNKIQNGEPKNGEEDKKENK